ncbi:hypothetical protein [Nonomuraea cavernae]|uniref:Uncharacterized protein n=1 Tax=Nonomuraea cavernae TaxID=2045107 RepID=A0A917ZAK5_9ACTN|nr:hypothetical protein [Nonomuraea cavernae]MCA2186392.1 hypothetical protein [Nonomuraea cavernae]GGO79262.1 hypothetical protein GCM10012289_63150 [Nonomuraea cavernae]
MPGPAAEAPSPAAAVLRLGAVLAASGPVILTTFGVGRQSVGWFCSVTDTAPYQVEGPYALENVPGELLFWGVLLLPVVVAGLLLRGSRRATLTAVAAVGAVLAFGLVTAFLLPGPDPCTGQDRAVVPPWPLIVCYPVAAGALRLAARSPLPRRRHGFILWAGAVVAAAWTPMFHRWTVASDNRLLSGVYIQISESFWDDLAWWTCEADGIGLPVVLVVLAATANVTASIRWGRLAGTAAAAALLLFPLLDVVTYISQYSGDVEMTPFVDSIRWPLLSRPFSSQRPFGAPWRESPGPGPSTWHET